MSFTFEDAEIVHTSAGGKRKEDNPFSDVVASIALRKDDKNKPVAKAFTVTSENADAHVTDVNRARRQLTEAGKDNDPAVTVQSRANPVEGNPLASVVTFWTIKKIVRAVGVREDSKPAV